MAIIVLIIILFFVLRGIKLPQSSRIQKDSKQASDLANNEINEFRRLAKTIETARNPVDVINAVSNIDPTIQRLQECKKYFTNDNKRMLEAKVSELRGYEQEINNDLQWRLCDSIERMTKDTSKDIRITYRNSDIHRNEAYDHFFSSIESSKSYFSENTNKLAQNCCSEIQSVYNSEKNVHVSAKSADSKPKRNLTIISQSSTINDELSKIDDMEGHAFEAWCAELLRANGFEDISITQGSGDQGVDVLAEKGGIRYAIQCKCYSSDLGNTPIQEVHAGKDFYNCHVGVVMTNRYFTAGAKQAAERTRTILWDRNAIIDFLNSAVNRQTPAKTQAKTALLSKPKIEEPMKQAQPQQIPELVSSESLNLEDILREFS